MGIDRLLTRCGFADQLKLLNNLETKVKMPETVKNDLCQQSEIGRALYEDLSERRIHLNKSKPLVYDEETQTAYVKRQRKDTKSNLHG